MLSGCKRKLQLGCGQSLNSVLMMKMKNKVNGGKALKRSKTNKPENS
jgi:hypothetical protein